LNFKELQQFQVVYETLSLNTAAKQLYISPQGLGRVVKKLEEECGMELFRRTSSGLTPTESGKVFYERSLEITGRFSQMMTDVQNADSRSKQIRMGFATGVLRAIPMETMAGFMNHQPMVRSEWYELENETVAKKVQKTELEYGFVIGKPQSDDLHYTLLRRQPVVLAVYEGHPLNGRNNVTVQDLQNEPLMTMNEQYFIYHETIRRCQEAGFAPTIVAKAMEGDTLLRLVEQKIGIAVLPRFPKLGTDTIRYIPFEDAPTWDIYGIYRKDNAEVEFLSAMDTFFEANLKTLE